MSEQSWTVTGPQAIDVDGVASLRLGVVRGRFDVVTHADPVTRIEISDVHGDPVAVSLTDGRLEVRHQLHGPQGWFRNLMGAVSHNSENSAVISIAVPAGVEIEAGTVSGDGLVSGITGRTRLNTVSGSVMADHTAGELHINTVSGDVTARASPRTSAPIQSPETSPSACRTTSEWTSLPSPPAGPWSSTTSAMPTWEGKWRPSPGRTGS
jgi:hypothetical protein